MHSYVTLNHTPETFEVGLFVHDNFCSLVSEDKRLASKFLVPILQKMLTENNVTLSELSYIGINQGPGLFSTLRSILSTAHGLHCATKIPLIGIDGLQGLLYEYTDANYSHTVALLDACNKEIYYAIAINGTLVSTGYNPISTFLSSLKHKYPLQKIHFIGAGSFLYKDSIEKEYGSHAIVTNRPDEFCSSKTVAKLSCKKFKNNNEAQDYLLPLHLKKHSVEL